MLSKSLSLTTLFCILGLLLLNGCAGTSKIMLGTARTPIHPDQVQIYTTPPPGAVDIAQIEVASGPGFGGQRQTNAALNRLKREAAALGANGIVLIGVETGRSPVDMRVGGATYGSHTGAGLSLGLPTQQKQARGMAIWVPNTTK